MQAVLFGTQLPMFGYWVLSVGVPIALVMWAGSVVRFDREVSYVGSLGVARFGYRGSRDRFAVAEVFLFEDAGFLLVECQKEAYAIKWCTAWTFSWMRWEDEEVVHARSCRFFSRSELPKETDDSYHFVRATEVAWSEYLRRFLPQSCVSMPK